MTNVQITMQTVYLIIVSTSLVKGVTNGSPPVILVGNGTILKEIRENIRHAIIQGKLQSLLSDLVVFLNTDQ